MDVRHMHMFASIVLYCMQNYPSTEHNHAQDKVTMYVRATHLPRSVVCCVCVAYQIFGYRVPIVREYYIITEMCDE